MVTWSFLLNISIHRKLLELISEFNKLRIYKVNTEYKKQSIEKSIMFQYNKMLKICTKMIPFTTYYKT